MQEKGRWILTKLQEAQEREQRHASTRIVWCDGALVPYLGASVQLLLDPGHTFRERGAHLRSSESEPGAMAGGVPQLALGLAHSATAPQIRDAAKAWLMRQAEQNFRERLDHFAPLLGVRWTTMRLSNAGTRWGSARSDGSVRLNWRLIHFSQPVIDYVVAHELSHLRVMNHSPQFWDTVASVVPDYALLRRQLKHAGITPW